MNLNNAYDFQQPTLDLNVFGDPGVRFLASASRYGMYSIGDDGISVLDLETGSEAAIGCMLTQAQITVNCFCQVIPSSVSVKRCVRWLFGT